MSKYLIIASYWQQGQVIVPVAKEEVREECEYYKNFWEGGNKDCYKRIEVVNTETGEIREYWNNHDNKIQF